MSSEDKIVNVFREGLKDCPSFEAKLSFAQGNAISNWDTGHIKLCPLCQNDIEVLKGEEFSQENVLPQKTVLALQKIEKELVKNKYAKALPLCQTYFWDHSSKEHEVKILLNILVVRSEMLIQRKKWASAMKLLECCENKIKFPDARVFYLMGIIHEHNREWESYEKCIKKAKRIDSEIINEYTITESIFILKIKNIAVEVVKITNKLVGSVQKVLGEIVEGTGSMEPVTVRGKERGKEIKKELKGEGLKVVLTTNLKTNELEISNFPEEINLTDLKGNSIPGKRQGKTIIFNLD